MIEEFAGVGVSLKPATGIAPRITGKPERLLFEMALRRMKANPDQTAVLGDRLETDILGEQGAGLKTILVTTRVENKQSIFYAKQTGA